MSFIWDGKSWQVIAKDGVEDATKFSPSGQLLWTKEYANNKTFTGIYNNSKNTDILIQTANAVLCIKIESDAAIPCKELIPIPVKISSIGFEANSVATEGCVEPRGTTRIILCLYLNQILMQKSELYAILIIWILDSFLFTLMILHPA